MAALAGTLVAPLQALHTSDRELLPNMQVEYRAPSARVYSLRDFIARGTFYGRIRSHIFHWD